VFQIQRAFSIALLALVPAVRFANPGSRGPAGDGAVGHGISNLPLQSFFRARSKSSADIHLQAAAGGYSQDSSLVRGVDEGGEHNQLQLSRQQPHPALRQHRPPTRRQCNVPPPLMVSSEQKQPSPSSPPQTISTTYLTLMAGDSVKWGPQGFHPNHRYPLSVDRGSLLPQHRYTQDQNHGRHGDRRRSEETFSALGRVLQFFHN
jgi:hypothetical protein